MDIAEATKAQDGKKQSCQQIIDLGLLFLIVL
jgi:hypothetical protein